MAEKTKLWYLENFNIFKGLQESSMMELGQISSMQEFPKNQLIYFAKEPSNSIFFLKQGRVKLTRSSSEGKEMILGLVNMGEVFGELSFIDEGQRTDYAIALDNCTVCAINKEEFRHFVEKNPELNLKLTRLIGLRLKKYSERIEELIFKDANQRIISFLLKQTEEQGKKVGDEYFVKPFLKHQDIAELTACSRQTVNAVLTELRDNHIIDFDRKKLVLHNISKLQELLK